jgi:transposase InsO family protein
MIVRDGGKPSKPWLTVILDDYSRAVTGYFLSFETPSAVEILLQFTAATSHEHPHLRAAIANYSVLLEEMGRSPAQIRAQVEGVVQSMPRL